MQSSYIKNLDNIKKIHFIGIGGSGMFPIARILKEKGYEITGSDIYESDTIEKVRNIGIHVKMEQKEENIIDNNDFYLLYDKSNYNNSIKYKKFEYFTIHFYDTNSHILYYIHANI